MKAVYYMGDNHMELKEIPVPAPKEDEYLVKNRRMRRMRIGLLKAFGKTGRRIAPMIMGHECAGRVEYAPKGAAYSVGTKVAVFRNFIAVSVIPARRG